MWRRSSRCDTSACVEVYARSSHCAGGDCVEVAFAKSSRSYDADCVEVGTCCGDVLVRDSKDPDGPRLSFGAGPWGEFLAGVKAGAFDRRQP